MFGTSFEERKFSQDELDAIQQMDWMKCPACYL